MVTNSITYMWRTAKSSGVVKNILNSIDDKMLDDIVANQRINKTGIYKTKPCPLTARELQEVGTKLAYPELRHKKILELASKYPTETKILQLDGQAKEFTIFKGSVSGSNDGYWATIKGTEDLYYIKYGSEAHIRSEKLAGELYELGGIPSTQKRIVSYTIPAKNKWSSPTEQIGIACKYMPVNYLPTNEEAKIVREGFGLDCWLANWDALKDGNVVMSAGNAARLDVGGSLCYRARGARKGADFGENVNEMTSFFKGFSHSKPYIKDMTREELIASLDRVSSIPDHKITELIDNAAQYKTKAGGINHTTGQYEFGLTHTEATGIQNPEYLKETLIARKNYITRFKEACRDVPQLANESIEEYIKRVDSLISKKEYQLQFDRIQMSSEITGIKGLSMAERMTPSQKAIYEESHKAYLRSKDNLYLGKPGTNILTQDSMLHATSHENLARILNDGITSGDLRGTIGSGTGVETQTQLCADFWDVQSTINIKDYFARKAYNPGEANFLPKLNGAKTNPNAMVFVVDKKRVAPTIMKNSFRVCEGSKGSILYKDGNMAGHSTYITHRAVPIGVPANSIDRIIIRKEGYSPEAIQQIKDMIQKRGLRINLYDLDGNLL